MLGRTDQGHVSSKRADAAAAFALVAVAVCRLSVMDADPHGTAEKRHRQQGKEQSPHFELSSYRVIITTAN
jgi:hypothetical protein